VDASIGGTTGSGGDGRHRGVAQDRSVAVAEPPARTGAPNAHWADRNRLYKRPDGTGRPFRRPPAEMSFPAQDTDVTEARGDLPRQRRGGADPEPATIDLRPQHDGDTDTDTDTDDDDDTRARHWTTIGTATRRPRTSDRDEVTTPGTSPRRGFRAPAGGGQQPAAPADAARQEAARQDFARAERRTGGRSAPRPSPRPSPRPAPDVEAVAAARIPADARAATRPGPTGGSRPEAVDATEPPGSFFAADGGPQVTVASIGDLTGEGREIRPHRAARKDAAARTRTTAPARGGAPAPAPRRRQLLVAGLVVLGLVGGGVGALYAFADPREGIASVLRSDATGKTGRAVAAPLDGRTAATFEVAATTELVTVQAADLGNELYRVTAADDSGVTPAPALADDTVKLGLTPSGDAAGGGVEVVLNSRVQWALRLTGGVRESRIDMSAGKVTGVELRGGAQRVELTLGAPARTVGITVTGAVDELAIKAPKQSPVRLTLDSGAKTVAAGPRTLRDVEPGATVTPRGWDTNGRYDATVASRATLVSVEAG
jgi:hypothetical protein